jgi:hypothetical protein
MSPLILLWTMVIAFGVAGALAPLYRFPSRLPSSAEERQAWRDGLAPLIARSVRGAALMMAGMAGLLGHVRFDAAVLGWGIFALSVSAAGVLSVAPVRRLTSALVHVRSSSGVAAWVMCAGSVAAVIDGLFRLEEGGLLMLATGALLFAVMQVEFVIQEAAGDVLSLESQ